MALSVLYPHAAWLLLLLPLLWRTAGRDGGIGHRVLRTAIFVALIAALMQPSLLHDSGQRTQVFVLDQGAGLSDAQRQRAQALLRERLQKLERGSRTHLVQLGGEPVDARVDRYLRLDDARGAASLSSALTQALHAIALGTQASVTLIGDGRSGDRHWDRAVAAFASRGIAVNTVELDAPPGDAFIAEASVAPAHVGEAVRVVVGIEGQGEALSLSLYSGERLLASEPVLRVDGAARVELAFPAERAGFLPLRAELTGEGAARDAAFETVAAVQDPLPVLYLGERQAGALPHLQRLLGDGFALEQQPADRLDGGFDFSRYRAVFIDDLPRARLADAAQRRLLAAIADDGVGLLHSGGEAAFGMGGWADAPLAAALPVEARQDEQVQEPSVALAIIIDTSGSMAGAPLELAKQIARLSVRKLTPADSVGIVEFYGTRQWAVPMQPVRSVAEVERAIGRMQAKGATMLFPAIQEAYYGLKSVDARFKHILVISDAGVEQGSYQQLLRHIARDRINVSTALVGGSGEGEARMAELANWGRGRFYAVADEFSLVELDLKQPQIKPASGYREGRFPVDAQAGRHWWPDMDMAALPALRGYARLGKRAHADILMTAGDGEPLLASWHYGAGRTTALATEPLGQGTGDWRGWPDYGQWLARVLARTASRQAEFDLRLVRRFDRLRIEAQRLKAGPAPAPELRLVDAQGDVVVEQVPVEEKAPGLFVAELDWDRAQPALLELHGGAGLIRAADRAHSDLAPAGRMPARNTLPLAALSRATGGTHAFDSADMPAATSAGPRNRTRAAADLWPWLSLLALLLYLAELLYRRWPSGRGVPRQDAIR
ncbi:VWA domain-containing protein [Luteimonas sp. XNQY3]|nr:VWA domain-containing protein [Luteimonas sp. XNQY3]MCD9005876.1 VWA domain-containing protein [Luteimonas sp. XNQY3]